MADASRNGGDFGVGRLIRARRLDAGLTQRALADFAGVSVATIRDLEQGRTRRPRTALVDRLAAALNLERDQMLERTPDALPRHRGPGLWLGVLGSVTASRDGQALTLGEPRQRGILGLLALNAGAGVHRAALVDAIWGDRPPAAAVNLVQAYVGRLRRIVDPGRSPRDANGVLVSTGTSYRMHLAAEQLDWLEFRHQVGRAARPDGDALARCDAYRQALRLWRGEPLADVDVLRGHPSVAAASREWAAAVAGYAEAAFQAGLHERVLPYLWQWAAGDPLHERAHAMLMVALAGSGQQAAALDVFAEVRERLDAQLGVRPGPELCDAHVRILRQEGAASPRDAVTVAAPPVPRQLPAPIRRFVGRARQLDALDDLVEPAGEDLGPVIVAITGTAGVGKSTLALHWAHRVADRFPDGQLYVNLRGFDPAGPPLDPAVAIRGFLDGLDVPRDRVPREPHAQAARYRSLLAGRRVLVVLDNVRDSDQARPLLPGAAGAMVMITSRSDLTGLAMGEGARTIDLPLLGHTESLHLLASHLGADWMTQHAGTAGELVRLCARLPLALSIIGARAAAHPDFPPALLADQLLDTRDRLDALTAGEASSDLRAVLACSYENLRPAAGRLFRYLALHPGPDISAPAAASLIGEPAGSTAVLLEELTRAHLVTEHIPGRYALHDLLRAYAAEQVHAHDDEQERRAAVTRMLDHYLHTAHVAALLQEPPRDPLPLPRAAAGVTPESLADDARAAAWFAAEHAVLTGCVALAANQGQARQAWQLGWTLMTAFSRSGHWHDLASALVVALEASVRAGDLAGQAYMHRFLGRVRALQGAHDVAHDHLREALTLFGRLGDAAGQAAVHVGLIRECERRKQHRTALEHAKQALDLQRAAGYRVGEAIALNNVGWCYVRLGEYHQALSWCRESLDLQQEIGYRPGEAYTWDTLGLAYHHLQCFQEATWCYSQALDIYRRLDDRYEQAATLTRLGDTHDAAGENTVARGRWRQALALLDELHHPDAGDLRHKLSRLTASAGTR